MLAVTGSIITVRPHAPISTSTHNNAINVRQYKLSKGNNPFNAMIFVGWRSSDLEVGKN